MRVSCMLLIRKMPPSLWQTVCSSSSYFQTAVLSFLQRRLALIIRFLFSIFTVRSFGTEDREVEKYIAPRDEQFEFIVFRGQDIKDLHVCEAPQQNQERVNAHLPQDPAIVQVFAFISNGSHEFGTKQVMHFKFNYHIFH